MCRPPLIHERRSTLLRALGRHQAAIRELSTPVIRVYDRVLLLPLVALFAEVPLRRLPDLLADPAVRSALRVTAQTNLAANVLTLLVGTPAAYLVGTREFRGKALVLSAVELPLVLPPAVAGISPHRSSLITGTPR